MARLASEIIKENKEIAAARDAIHQRQMAEVGAKNAARTAAVLNKAGIKTKTNPNTYEVSIAGDPTPRPKEARQRLDLQKKKEDQLEAKNPVDSLQIKKDRTEKEYDEYVSSDDYRKKQTESIRDQQRAMDQDESRSFASTSDFGAFPAAQDAMEARLRQEKERAESEFNAREDRETFEKGMAEIDAMPEEDLVLLDEYVRNRDNRQDVFVNDISWLLSNKKEGDALKALAEKYGEEKALQLAEIYGMNLHEQNAKAAEEQGKAGVNDSWISATAHNLLGIPARAFGNISGFTGRLSAEANRTGQFHGLPTYTAGDELSAYGNAVTGQTAQNIEGDVYDENGNLIEDGGALRKVASWGYQGAMSIADRTARLAMSGGNSAISSAIAGMGTFNQSVQKYSAMGASPEQAYTAATMSAGIEYITEKLPMDEALKLLRSGGDPGVVRKVLTQAFLVEPTTEEVNLFANMAMETRVLGEKSSKEQRIGDLIAGGLKRDQAEQQFWKETWMQVLETYAVSAFAGLIGGGSAAYAGNQMQQVQEQQQVLTEDPSAQLKQEAQPPVPTAAEMAQLAMDDTVAGLQETAPAAAPEAPMNDQQQNLQMAMEDLMGGKEQETAQDPRVNAIQKMDAEREISKQRQQQVYEELLAAKRRQKDLQKQITKAEQKLQDTGRGSQARINQLKTELEQQDNLVAQLESQNTYFTGDYERTLEEAVKQQEAVFENAREEARQAIADHEAGLITDAQLQAAQDKYNTAGQEVYRLKHMTQEEYAAELAEVGLVADIPVTPKPAQQLKPAAETAQETAPAMEERVKAQTANSDTLPEAITKAVNHRNTRQRYKTINEIITTPEAMAYVDSVNPGDNSKEGKLARAAEVVEDLYRESERKKYAPKQQPVQTEDAQSRVPAAADNAESVGDNLTATTSSPQTEDSGTMPADGGQIPTKGEKDGQRVLNGFASSDFRNSNTYMNTGLQSENANIRKGYRQELRKNPDAAKYAVKHNADTLAEAQSRTGSPENNAAALQDLMNRDHWTPEDVATSTLLLDEIMASGDKGSIEQLNALRQKRKEAGTYSGQVAQSFSIKNPTMKAADSPATAVDTFRANLDGLKQEETTWNKRSGVDFETWKNQIKDDVDRIGIAIATVEDGDSDSMRQIIRQIAQRRGTTAWFGTSQNLTGNAWSVLKKLDFQDLKKVANTQLVAMADDYRARGAGEVAKGLRKQNMLSSLKTFVRNISGNAVGSFADSVSDSGAGRMADAVLSKFTGKQTMGSDILRASDYAKAAREAGQFASLCVELNIPIETDVDSSYSAAAGNSGNNKYLGKTFRATGNPAMRALYAYQKYMSYALEVTDKIFEGGTNAAVAESLNRLQGANLTEEEVGALADFTGNRRTFKNATWEEDGKTKGSTLARKASGLQNELGIVGEVAMPFVSTPMNVTQTGIDYTAGVVKGLGEMIGIIQDAKAGKTIPVERQRQAASDFGRGVTGTAMIAMFASAAAMGALKVSNDKDWDKEALAQAEGRSGAQINWSALQRGMNGEDAKWQSGDVISGMDFLEPFNTQMYLGAELSQADDFNLLTGAGATIKSVWQSLMDSPVMTGLADIEQTLNDISEAESTDDAVNVAAGYAGDVASSYVPQFVRQMAQNQDGYYRDTRGENALDSAINSFMAAIPGQSEKLPVKYSGLGEAQKRGSAVETFLDPTATKEFQQNEVTTFLDELSGKVGESANNIYPDRQAPMKFTYGDDREVTLDGPMRETYQKTYGEKVNQLYTSLIRDKDFQGFSDELKIKALEEAKGYATQYAKAAVSDYREAPIGTVEDLAKGIVQREVRGQMDAFFTDLDTQREYGYSTEETAAKLEESYQAFTGLSQDTQKEILEQATSDTAKYLEVRQKGVSTEQYLRTTQKLDGLKVQPTYGGIRPAQQWQAIADMVGMSDSAKDTLMKAYMEDYDPNVKGSDTVELKYDYARQELDMSASEFALAYDIYSHEKHVGGDGTADRTRERMERELGITKAEAKQLYKLYGGYWKPWKE